MFPKTTYQKRREALKSMIPNGIILIVGHTNVSIRYPDDHYKFRQDSSFLYYFGLSRADCLAVIDVDSEVSYIFADDIDEEGMLWMGEQPSIEKLAKEVGVTHTASFSQGVSFVKKAQHSNQKIHTFPPYRAETKIILSELLDIKISELDEVVSIELIKASVMLRSIKSQEEIAEIEKASEVGYMMHTTAMKMAKVGKTEQELVGVIEGIATSFANGIESSTILSQNGHILHNHDYNQILEEGRLLLVDAGAETAMGYCSDNTRTFPVSGKFSPKQKAIYNIVLKANEEAIKHIAVGVKYRDIHYLAVRIIIEGLKALGIMQGSVDRALESGAYALFMPHGLGHFMGLDVHDMESYGEDLVGYDEQTVRSNQFGVAYLRLARKLEEGFVLTVEPGIYFIPRLIERFKKEGRFIEYINYELIEKEYLDFGGIRIEDDVVVTADGCSVLGQEIPKSVEDIENIMKEIL